MTDSRPPRLLLDAPRIVATVHCPEDIAAARSLDPASGIDLVELRLDSLPASMDAALALAASPPRPILATARGHAEGGAQPGLDSAARAALYGRFLPHACAIDIELADAAALAPTIRAARESGRLVVLSMHDFDATPAWPDILAARRRALDAGAHVFKLATLIGSPGDLARLHQLVAEFPADSAAMGMGPLGMPSRLLLACAGSRLNYGCLTRPNAPGQWPAARLAALVRECSPERDAGRGGGFHA